MRISVVGAGYVGLVSGVCLAEAGHQVVCVEIDPAKVAQILGGVPPIHEEGLAELLRGNLGKRLAVTGDLHSAVIGSELTLIAVGTPYDGARIDLSFVHEAARGIGAALREKSGYHVVAVLLSLYDGTSRVI